MNIVLIGAPGSGKGTISPHLEKDFGLKHLSTGQLLRERSENDKTMANFLKTGNLLDDKTMAQILQERLQKADCKNGVVLDGFPRTLQQAKLLEKIIKIDFVVFLKVNEKEILKRLLNRMTCPQCSSVYNRELYTKSTCSVCGSKLVMRSDDNEKTISNRIKIFNGEVQPILKFYGGKVVEVNAVGEPKQVYETLKKILKKEVQKIGCENSRRN